MEKDLLKTFMNGPLGSLFKNLGPRRVVETVIPERTLADVVLPPQTRGPVGTGTGASAESHLDL